MINGKHIFHKIIFLVLVLLVSSPTWASNVKSKQADDLVLMPAISLLLNSTNIIALGPGGELTFPKGSLPPGTKVTVKGAIPPILSDDLIAVGLAFQVTVDQQPTTPVKVTLPVPAGENPDDLVLIRLESHGRITLLQTEIENKKLVAWTPGFSYLAAARMVKKLKDGYKPWISGPDILPINTKGQYSETQFAQSIAGTRQWQVWSSCEGTITYPENNNPTKSNRIFVSAPKPGPVTLMMRFTEPETGLHASAIKSITIIGELEGLDLDVYGPSVVKSGESFDLKTVVLNTEAFEIHELAWILGNKSGSCLDDGCSIPFEVNNLSLDNSSFFTEKATFTITATPVLGDQVTVLHHISVLSDYFTIINFSRTPADDVLIWNESSPIIPISFEAQVEGGTVPYDYEWSLKNPETVENHNDNYNDVDRFDATLNQPGVYSYSVLVGDSCLDCPVNYYYGYLSVKEANLAEYFNLSGLSSSNATVNQPVQATLQASGGVMYLAPGHCPDYLYWIDWGDGSGAGYGQIASTDPVAGGSIGLTHTYTATGTYTVKYYAIPKGCRETPLNILVQQNYDDLPVKTASITVDEPPPGQVRTCITDPQTVSYRGQIWQRCDDGVRYPLGFGNYLPSAVEYCQDLVLGGYSDWHLPTKDELKNLVYCSNGAPTPLPDDRFSGDQSHCGHSGYGLYDRPTIDAKFVLSGTDYWSSTEYGVDGGWIVNFTYGWADTTSQALVLWVRCVR